MRLNMKGLVKNIWIFISTLFLAGFFLLIFGGGTWKGVRIWLEILGALFLLKTAYDVVMKKNAE
jgi:hypothetical protein